MFNILGFSANANHEKRECSTKIWFCRTLIPNQSSPLCGSLPNLTHMHNIYVNDYGKSAH